jgi:hypothetical protein
MIIKKSRSLCFTSNLCGIICDDYHRRHSIRVYHNYGTESPIDAAGLTKIGKTLRSRKHHVPRYKIVRCKIDWTLMIFEHSVNQRWRNARREWIKLHRDIEKLQTKHLDKMITTHWWKI